MLLKFTFIKESWKKKVSTEILTSARFHTFYILIIFYNITVFTVFSSRKCSLGENKRLLLKTFKKNLTDPKPLHTSSKTVLFAVIYFFILHSVVFLCDHWLSQVGDNVFLDECQLFKWWGATWWFCWIHLGLGLGNLQAHHVQLPKEQRSLPPETLPGHR